VPTVTEMLSAIHEADSDIKAKNETRMVFMGLLCFGCRD
jgi:hypothetical protein